MAHKLAFYSNINAHHPHHQIRDYKSSTKVELRVPASAILETRFFNFRLRAMGIFQVCYDKILYKLLERNIIIRTQIRIRLYA